MLTKTTDKTSSAVRALRAGTDKILAGLQNAAGIMTAPLAAQVAYS